MKWTPKHMAYAGIVVAGIAIVAIDRFILSPGGSGPRPASAEASIVEQSPPDAAADDSTDVPGTDRSRAPAAPRQNHLDHITRLLTRASERRPVSIGQMHDAFAVGDAWAGRANGKSPVQPSQTPADVATEQFKKSHTLMAVINTGQQPRALVGNHLLKVGEKVGDATLIAVDGRSAAFDIQGVRVTLTLPEEGR